MNSHEASLAKQEVDLQSLSSNLSEVIRRLREDTYAIFDEKLDSLDLLDSPADKQRRFTKMLKKFVVKQVEDMSSSESDEEPVGDVVA